MKITSLLIKNFKTIREMNIDDIEDALIIVGKNSTGKTTILHAILAIAGQYQIKVTDFNSPERNIEIAVKLEISDDDIRNFYNNGVVSIYKTFSMWYEDFCKQLPTFKRKESDFVEYAAYETLTPDRDDIGGILDFVFVADSELKTRYSDGVNKSNPVIAEVLPKVHFIDHRRNVKDIQDEIFSAESKNALKGVRENLCLKDDAKQCTDCFKCIKEIKEKTPEELSILESMRLLEYKILQVNLDSFMDKLNKFYVRNSGRQQDIKFVMNLNNKDLIKLDTIVLNKDRYGADSINTLSAGAKSIYILSLLEAYSEENSTMPSIIMIEDPEIYLHPSMQKAASEILYRLSKKNQVFFSTHSPNLIFNFNSKQIKQIVLDEDYNSVINENTDIDKILDDLGYSANDLMNVNFVFIVEGKQDSSRLPLLLKKYYSEVYNDDGTLQRISIVTTNSCTNIKTYANLKYINQLYLKDQFLMIRDSDGKNPETLVKQLCKYYDDRALEDVNSLPRIQPRNILILKYYSFENYFLNPAVMTKIGVIGYEEEFYNTLFEKYKAYLFKLASAKNMRQVTGLNIRTKDDLKKNIETFKIYMRGHNLFDIFYGRYKGEKQTEILTRYIEEAPREDFADILNAIDRFIYFMNRRIEDKEETEKKPEYTYQKHKKKKKYNRNGYDYTSKYRSNNDQNNKNGKDGKDGQHGQHSKQHVQFQPKNGSYQSFGGKKNRHNNYSDYRDDGYSDLSDSVFDD